MNRKIFSLFVSFLLFSFPLISNVSPFFVGAYYESWAQFPSTSSFTPHFTPNQIDPDLLTDLYYAFAVFGVVPQDFNSKNPHLTGGFQLHPLFPNDKKMYQECRDLKKRSEGRLRLFLSIGGESFNNPNDPYGLGRLTYPLFSKMVTTKKNRKEFIDSAIEYAHSNGFDGIDIDWEYPGDLSRGGSEADFIHFPQFLQECSSAFHSASPPLLLSIAVPADIPSGVPQKYRLSPRLYYEWLNSCMEWVDRITLMAYDYHTPSDDRLTGANAPLFHDTNPKSNNYIAYTVDQYIVNNLPLKKVMLGIPLYGWGYQGVKDLTEESTGPGKPFRKKSKKTSLLGTSSFLPYSAIDNLINQKKIQFKIDPITTTAYGYNLNEKLWISFDNPETVKAKALEAKGNNLLGVVFWAIDQDEFREPSKFPNIRAAIEVKNKEP